MLAYAPRHRSDRFHPSTLALVLAIHAGVLVAVLSARMAVERYKPAPPTTIELIPAPKPPKADDPTRRPLPRAELAPPAPQPLVPIEPDRGPSIDVSPLPANPGPAILGDQVPLPLPQPALVRTGPRFDTPAEKLRPPYPESRRTSGEEAALRLRLAIDERGRVTTVEAVGTADPVFLEAARRHILRYWRYRPAMEGDRAVTSSTVVTLRFELD